jgi:hypothetical protein
LAWIRGIATPAWVFPLGCVLVGEMASFAARGIPNCQEVDVDPAIRQALVARHTRRDCGASLSNGERT